jgi:acetyl esterase/lipase
MGGKVRKREMTVPAEGDRPEMRIVVLSPTEPTGPWPGIYHTHGGGMIVGAAEDGLEEFAPLVAEFGAVVVSPDYLWGAKTRFGYLDLRLRGWSMLE